MKPMLRIRSVQGAFWPVVYVVESHDGTGWIRQGKYATERWARFRAWRIRNGFGFLERREVTPVYGVVAEWPTPRRGDSQS